MRTDFIDILITIILLFLALVFIFSMSAVVSLSMGTVVYYETAKEGWCLSETTPAFLPNIYWKSVDAVKCPEMIK